MRFSVWPGPHQDFADILALALHVEAGGWDGVWLADRIPDATFVVREEEAHLSPLLGHWPEILTTLARAAGA